MEPKAVAFDLGGTLVRYYEREQFPAILAQALADVQAVIPDRPPVPPEVALGRAMAENRERPDGAVCPVHERLARIFGLPQPVAEARRDDLATAFLKAIFACACKYDDTDRALADLRERGCRLAIVSNAPWGTPSGPWREELRRHGLLQAVDAAVFCVDAGWRKPAPPIFAAALHALGTEATETVFVGDDPRWDCAGAQAAGMVPILIDRTGRHPTYAGSRIARLDELPETLRRL